MKIIKNKIVIITFTLLIMLSFISSLNYVFGQTSYEWISNKSFEDGLGLSVVNNGDFESGSFSNGWSAYSATISSTLAYSPIYSARFVSSTEYIQYNFTTPIPISSINTFYAYTRSSSIVANLIIYAYYTDNTNTASTQFDTINLANTWEKSNLRGNITFTEGKLLNAFRILLNTASITLYIDNVVMGLYETGQTDINQTSLPWYQNGYSTAIQQLDIINNTFGKYGSACFQDSFGYNIYNPVSGQSTTSSVPLITWQQLPNAVYTNNITSLTLWARAEDYGAYSITMYFIYSDGFMGEKSVNFNAYNQWTQLDFKSGLLSGKALKIIGFKLTGGTVAINENDHNGKFYVYIDDISLLANVPTTTSTIQWTLTPTPLSWNIYRFTQTTGVQSVLTYFVYDFTGALTENGTAYISTSYGNLNATITNGVFSVILTARTIGQNTTEFITAQIMLTTRTLVFVIEANWITVTSTTSTPTGNYGTTTPILNANMIGGFILVIVFSLLFGVFAGKEGLMVGLIVAIFISSVSGLFPSYGLVLCVIIGAVLIVSQTGIPKTGNGGGTE